MKGKKIVGKCKMLVKNGKIAIHSNIPQGVLYSILSVLVEKYDLNNEEGIVQLNNTVVKNAKFTLLLDEDSVLTFEPAILNKTDAKRFISIIVRMYEEEKQMEENKNESSYS